MRVAAVDVGTNSVRLLIADAVPGAGLTELERRVQITRLGEGVDRTGRFAPAAVERTLRAVADYARRIEAAGCTRVRLVATSAARDAGNRDSFFAGVRRVLGVDAEVIAGEEEARLSFVGALAALPELAGPVLLCDIGGGSTELVDGTASRIRHVVSVPAGSVRLHERFVAGAVPTPAELGAMADYVDGLLDGSGAAFTGVATWVGVGGTATTLGAVAQGLTAYARERVQGYRIGSAELDAVCAELTRLAPPAIMTRYPWIPRGRAEVLAGGAVICARIAARVCGDLLACESDLLDAVALELLDD